MIANSMTITGPGANVLAVSGGGRNQVFDAGTPGAISDADITISGLTIEDGVGSLGGGVSNLAYLRLEKDSLIDNKGDLGGGIYADNTVWLTDSTVADNEGGQGAGIYSSNDVAVVNSTIAYNGRWDPDDLGGGFVADGGFNTIQNSTISNNSGTDGDLDGVPGSIDLEGTIVANASPDCVVHVGDFGYNLDDDGSCGFSGSSLSDTSAGLAGSGLTNVGGPTETILPTLQSAAVGVIPRGTKFLLSDDLVCPRADQRGVSSYGKCTIGAVEGGFLITTTSLPTALPGKTYAAVRLTTQESAPKAVIRWRSFALPEGFRLSSTGLLSGRLAKKVKSGVFSISVRVTETYLVEANGAKTKESKTVRATIPLVIK